MKRWSIQEKEQCILLYLGVVGNEKIAFGSPSTTFTNFTFTTRIVHAQTRNLLEKVFRILRLKQIISS